LIVPSYNEGPYFAGWIMAQLGQTIAPPMWTISARDAATRKAKGGIIFSGWNGANLDITIYGPGCMSRPMIRGAFAYAFKGMQATRVTARTRVSNSLMRDMLPRLGFVFECELSHYYGLDDDALQFSMLREYCPWID
jgi:hypothetical protein